MLIYIELINPKNYKCRKGHIITEAITFTKELWISRRNDSDDVKITWPKITDAFRFCEL